MKPRNILLTLLPVITLMGCDASSSTKGGSSSDKDVSSSSTNEESVDYGTMSIGMQRVKEGYQRKIKPTFSKPEHSNKPVQYECLVETDGIEIDEDGTVYGCKSGTYKVRATSKHFASVLFNVRVESDSKFSSKVDQRLNTYLNKDMPEQGRTIFAGDSFFDTEFWSNFYSDQYYKSCNTATVGISATQASDWYYYVQKLIIPFEPENIVFHLGTNDINDGLLNGENTFDILKEIFEEIHLELPNTKIYIFGIEPSVMFSQNFDKEEKCNALTKHYCLDTKNMVYLDSPAYFLNEAKNGANSSMLRDGLHPKLENYSIYDTLLKEAGLVMTPLENK